MHHIRADRKGDKAAAGAAAKRIREQRADLARYNQGKPVEERIAHNDLALEGRILREMKGGEATPRGATAARAAARRVRVD